MKLGPGLSFLLRRLFGQTTHLERVQERLRQGKLLKVKDIMPYYQYPTEFPIETGEVRQCPRCLGPIPSKERAGQYRGAASRTDRSVFVEVCSACGSQEAHEQHHGVLTPQCDWPVTWNVPSAP